MRVIVMSIVCLMFYGFVQKKGAEYSTNNGNVLMLFNLNLGDMSATTNTASSTFEPATQKVNFVIGLKNFQFSNILVEYQFKETYMEVSKYPEAKFKGKIREQINTNIKIPQKVLIDGYLDMHGVIQKRIIPAIITCNGNQINVKANFNIRASEHKIDIPLAFFVNEKDVIKILFEGNYKKKES